MRLEASHILEFVFFPVRQALQLSVVCLFWNEPISIYSRTADVIVQESMMKFTCRNSLSRANRNPSLIVCQTSQLLIAYLFWNKPISVSSRQVT